MIICEPWSTESSAVVSTLLDANRLTVAGMLVGNRLTVDDLVAATGIERRRVLEAIGSLRQIGLVDVADGVHTIEPSTLHRVARDVAESAPPLDPYVGHGMTPDECEVLARFFFHGRILVEIPASRAKRLIVLERLALEFDIGRRYTEREVNTRLGRFHADVAALRRYLVDEDLLDRDGGQYWRSGGRTSEATNV